MISKAVRALCATQRTLIDNTEMFSSQNKAQAAGRRFGMNGYRYGHYFAKLAFFNIVQCIITLVVVH
jgi:hypothetical protein